MLRPPVVLFDVGDTLLVERRFDLEAGIRAAVPHRLTHVPALAAAFAEVLRVQHRLHMEPLLARWLGEHVASLSDRSVDDVEDMIWPAVVTLDVNPGVGTLLDQLRSSGALLGAVSNAYFSGRILDHELKRHGLADFFAFVLSSGDLGWRKPAPAIFEAALRRAGAAASEAWFVGDTYDEDVIGAMHAGLTAIWLRPGPVMSAVHDGIRHVDGWREFGALWTATETRQRRSDARASSRA